MLLFAPGRKMNVPSPNSGFISCSSAASLVSPNEIHLKKNQTIQSDKLLKVAYSAFSMSVALMKQCGNANTTSLELIRSTHLCYKNVGKKECPKTYHNSLLNFDLRANTSPFLHLIESHDVAITGEKSSTATTTSFKKFAYRMIAIAYLVRLQFPRRFDPHLSENSFHFFKDPQQLQFLAMRKLRRRGKMCY